MIVDKVRNMKIIEKPRRKQEVKIITKPKPMNTIDLQVLASDRLNFSPDQTMDVAEDLYLYGYISYPRTESRDYPKNLEIKNLLINFTRSEDYGDYARELIDTYS